MKLYSIDLLVVATAYIRADSEEAAKAAAATLHGDAIEVSGGLISDLEYSHPDLPAESLSPAMMIKGFAEDPPRVNVAYDPVETEKVAAAEKARRAARAETK